MAQRLFAASLLALSLGACTSSTAPASTTADGKAELGASLQGAWEFDRAEVEFLDDKLQPVSKEATVFPDRDANVEFFDGTVSKVRLAGANTFKADGTLDHSHEIVRDGEVVESQQQQGTWAIDGDSVVIDIKDQVHVRAAVSFEEDGEVARLVWDRRDPMFLDASCILTLYLRRAE